MSKKRVVEGLARELYYLGHEFVHVIVTFCFEDKIGHIVLHVVSNREQGEIRMEQSILQPQSQGDRCAARMECAQTPI